MDQPEDAVAAGERGHIRAPAIRSYRDLLAWQRAYSLAGLVYDVADGLPDYERFALASQVRRAATSVYGNIAEGYGTGTRPAFLRYLRIARGSLCELDSHLDFIRDRKSAPVSEATGAVAAETGRLLQALISALERSTRAGPGKKPSRPAPTR